MAEVTKPDAGERAGEPPSPPPLPPRLADPVPVVVAGIALWFIAWVGFVVARVVYDAGSRVWMWTCFAGWVLGFVGLLVIRWQRAAARRGSRGAQRGA